MACGGLSSATVVRQLVAAITAAVLSFCCGCWMVWPSTAIPKLKDKSSGIVVSDEEVSWMVAAMDIGNVVSPLPAGYFMGSFGRKKAMICAGLMYLLSWILTAIANNLWYLYIARFIAGLGKGITFTTLPVYLGEISSVSIRGALSVLMMVLCFIGDIFTTIVGPLFSFKVVAVVLGIFPFTFLVIFPFMPESPYYLLMKGKEGDAFKAFKWLHGFPIDNEFEDIMESVKKDMKNKGKFNDLVLNLGNRRALTIVIITAILHRCTGGTSLLAYSSTTLPSNESWFGPSEALVLYSCVSLFSSILVTLLVDLWGRRPLVLLSSVGSAVLSGISAVFYYLYRETKVEMSALLWIPYVSLVLTGLLRTGLICIIETFQGELFTTNVRGQATATCTIVIAITNFFIDKLYVTIDINVGVYANFLFYSVCSILCGLFVGAFVFETKGKSFMEIQKMLCRNP